MKKILLFASGPGESSHAYAIARYLAEKNHLITIALRQHANCEMYRSAHFVDLAITQSPQDLRKLVHSIKPAIVLLCNSKAFNYDSSFVEHRPWPVPTFSIDSNWLFEISGPLRCLQWLDGYFALFPPQLFSLGLRENGGQFTIPSAILPRIKPVGFVPSYPKPDNEICCDIRKQLHLQKDEKLIFCYISGRGAGIKPFVLDSIFQVSSRLRYIGYNIKVCVVGNLDTLGHHFHGAIADWILFREPTFEDFYTHVASADLVFQHQGLATLAQAISAQVPIIANIRLDPLDFGEIQPFERAGLCKFFFASSQLDEIEHEVETLLYNKQERIKMQNTQKEYACQGEHIIYENILSSLQSD